MVGNAVSVHQRDEVGGCEARQGRAAELGVLSHKMLVRRTHVQIAVGEVAASAARDADLLGHLGRMIDQQHLQALLAGLGRAEQAGGTGADDDGVKIWKGTCGVEDTAGRALKHEQQSRSLSQMAGHWSWMG